MIHRKLKPSSAAAPISLAAAREALHRSPAISILIVLGIIAYIFQTQVSDRVFATASLDLSLPPEKILEKAKEKIQRWGDYRPGMMTSVSFDGDNNAKVFLERNYGQQEANKLMSQLPIWFWSCRFVKEGDPEAAVVCLDPSGKPLLYGCGIANDKPMPSLTREQAEALARAFVIQEAGLKLDSARLLQTKDTAQVHRTDHSFGWDYDGVDYKGAHLRIQVEVSGNKVTQFLYYLQPPESWQRSYAEMRSYNNMLGTVAYFFMGALSIATLVVFIRAATKRTFTYKTAIILGAFYGLAMIIPAINSMPSWTSSYKVSEPYTSFLIGKWFSSLVLGLMCGLPMSILFAAAQPLYRELCPQRMSIKRWFSLEALRRPELIEAIVVGIAVCGLQKGYQIAYYFCGEKLGYWCPLSSGAPATLGSLIPILDGLCIGVQAALMEEGLYRIVALRLFERLWRGNFWLANFLQALLWGFAHSYYPQQPAYARGVELTIEGMFNGWLLKRFGLLPCLLSHFLFDALCTSDVLKGAPPSVAWTGLVPVLIPLAVLAAAMFVSSQKGFVEEPASRADTQEFVLPALKHKTTMGRPIAFLYAKPLSMRARMALVVIAAACLAVTQFFSWDPIEANMKPLAMSRDQAVEKARQYFRDLNIDVSSLMVSTELIFASDPSSTLAYLEEHLGFERTKALVEKLRPPAYWRVRFFRPGWPNTLEAYFVTGGEFLSPAITLDENTNLPSLTEEQARALAEKYLKTRPKMAPWILSDVSQQKRQRQDYSFTYQVPAGKVGDALFEVAVYVEGNLLTDTNTQWKMPDSWTQTRNKEKPYEAILNIARTMVLLIGGAALLWFLVGLFREGYVRWTIPIIAGLVMILLPTLGVLNNLPEFFISYPTETPMANFLMQTCINLLWSFISSAFGYAISIMLTLAVINKYFKKSYLESAFKLAFWVLPRDERVAQRSLWLDAMITAFAITVAYIAIDRLTVDAKILFGHQPPCATFGPTLSEANTYFMSYGIIVSAVTYIIQNLSFIALVPAMAHKYLKGNWWLTTLVAVVSIAISETNTHYASDYLVSVTSTIITVAMTMCIFVAGRRNVVTAMLALLWSAFAFGILYIYQYGLPLLAFHFCLLVGICLAPVLYFFYLQGAADPPEPPEPKADAPTSEPAPSTA